VGVGVQWSGAARAEQGELRLESGQYPRGRDHSSADPAGGRPENPLIISLRSIGQILRNTVSSRSESGFTAGFCMGI